NGGDVENGAFDYSINAVAPSMAPQILAIDGAATGLVTITWSAVSGSIYRLQYTPDLSATNWTDVSPDVTAADSTASQTNNPDGAGQRFYRVILLP
ncbi:MAG: hypothetical protein QOJ40_1384, partial [Verrucomicrobiota bacterium]